MIGSAVRAAGCHGLSRSLADLTAPGQQLRQLGEVRRHAAGVVAGEQVRRWAGRPAVPSLYVVQDVGNWSAPCGMAAFARVVS
jgi:hypothetical protein